MAGKWTGGIVTETNGDGPPSVGEWVPVTVPGRSSTFAGADAPVAYRTTFADPRSSSAERTRLVLGGAYGRTRVWLNGTLLGEHSTYFLPARFEFEPQEANELLVVCEPPDESGAGGIYETDAVPAETAVPGIWWSVELQVRPPTFVSSLAAVPRVTDGEAVIDTEVTVDAGEAVDDAVTLSLRPEGFRGGGSMERVPVQADAGERVTVSKSLEVRDPNLWWPRGYGPQHRYTVRAKLGEDSAERTVGLRTIERDDEGLIVNGRRLRARGINRRPSVGGDASEDVRRAIDANATLVRVRGHVPSPEFYAACDETGVLVWQDLPLAEGEFEADRATALLESIATSYGSHPSLAMYGIRDDPHEPFADPLGAGTLAKLRFRWRAWRASFDPTEVETVAATVSDGRPVVSVAGQPGLDADATHLSPGWRYLEAADIDWLLERSPDLGRVVGDVEAGSLTGSDTDGSTDPTSIPGLDASILERHAEGVEASQSSQAATLKTVVEALRRHGSGILVAGTLRDAAVGGGMGVLSADGTAKPASEALAGAYEPVQVVLDGPAEPGSAGLTLCNDTDERVETTVVWRAGSEADEIDVVADPLESKPLETVEIPPAASELALECTIDGRSVRNAYRL
ncbi:glycoside hydrolase family 2 [Halobacteria archaeon AArc-m2/3/4]|uniref:Glycoside hydrolase family 2 n=1 Tax=Natronoglomus mannanivorans TaxID=2979990 RepID=A0AAP3E1V2_9EURY|nr:glycoside hydrolase family 2 [Halobacteria archaeon AArc-xg1-1]MCU4975149.1 glycoside hydrolase family 2 [Halobacteria archaeon AArc-m2/3/4]